MVRPRNPMKLDPSRTVLIRRAFAADMDRRFCKVKSKVWKLLVTEDVMGARTAVPVHDNPALNVTNNVTNAAQWKFETDDDKVKKFRRWLTEQVNKDILEISPTSGEPVGGKAWTYKYVDSAYKKGVLRSWIDTHKTGLKQPAGFIEGSKSQFLRQAFAQPERVSKLKLLYTRSYEDLKGVTATMSTKLSRSLATGLVDGTHPVETAREMVREIAGLTRTRAKVIALTETIHAHAEGQLDGLEDLGVEEVGADVEWSTAHDDGVCPLCAAMDGKVFTIAEARGMIPLHPRCRCAWLSHVTVPKLGNGHAKKKKR